MCFVAECDNADLSAPDSENTTYALERWREGVLQQYVANIVHGLLTPTMRVDATCAQSMVSCLSGTY